MPGGGEQTTVQSNDPWIGQQPYLEKGFEAADRYVLGGPTPYAPMSPYTMQGYDQWMASTQDPNSLYNQGYQHQQDVLNGYYLNGPGMEQNVDFVASQVFPTVDSQFALGNRTGSGIHAEKLGEGMMLGMTPYYNAELDRMMQASNMAPTYEQAGVSPYLAAGQAYESDYQNRLDAPYEQLARYMGLISGNYGGTVTSTVNSSPDPLMLGLGGLGLLGGFGFF